MYNYKHLHFYLGSKAYEELRNLRKLLLCHFAPKLVLFFHAEIDAR